MPNDRRGGESPPSKRVDGTCGMCGSELHPEADYCAECWRQWQAGEWAARPGKTRVDDDAPLPPDAGDSHCGCPCVPCYHCEGWSIAEKHRQEGAEAERARIAHMAFTRGERAAAIGDKYEAAAWYEFGREVMEDRVGEHSE